MNQHNIRMRKRLLFISITFSIIFSASLVRFFWIQIINGTSYRNMAYMQNNKSRVISAERGKIYDRNNNELAVNMPVNTISVNPLLIRKSKTDIEQIAQGMSEILQIDKKILLEKFQKPGQYEVIKRKIKNDTSDRLRQWVNDNKIDGIYFEEDTQRYYPGQNLAAQIIGFTGMDNQGLGGIEFSMERYLKGQPGKVIEDVDAVGRKLPFGEEERIDVSDGLNVVLTIDKEIQKFVEKKLQEAIDKHKVLQGGTAIVMDPRNGDILAMVSKPDFDLNDPFAFPGHISDKDYNSWNSMKDEDKVKELQKTVWTNKAINSTYEPGSTFKAVTAAAALEEGIVTPDSEVDDSPIKIAGWTINSMISGGHGKETFRQSVYNSDNPVFVKLAQTLGMEKFYSYLGAFGFYDRTGINLSGEANSIFQKKPAEIDMATTAFGQGFQITPMQMITAYTAIENGGKLMRPRLVKELTDSDGNVAEKFDPEIVRNVISRQTSETLKDILEGVVLHGTGIEANVEGYRVAGKTGTSETFENGVRSKERFIASFMGFAPANNPVISVLVILDHPDEEDHFGGTVAAPAAAEIIEYTLDYLGVEKEN